MSKVWPVTCEKHADVCRTAVAKRFAGESWYSHALVGNYPEDPSKGLCLIVYCTGAIPTVKLERFLGLPIEFLLMQAGSRHFSVQKYAYP